MFGPNGVNHAANLPAMDNAALQILLGTRLSEYVIAQYRRTLPLHLFLHISSDVDFCQTITYMCENHDDLPRISDTAIDGSHKRKTISPPTVKSFRGYCKAGFETKLSSEQLHCINGSSILSQWYNSQMRTAIEDAKNSVMARFYRQLLSSAHPKNSGSNAGMTTGGQQVGTRTNPILFDVDNADLFMSSILNTVKQMPRTTPVDNEFGVSAEDAFIFGPPSMESVFMNVEKYMSYNSAGNCAACSLFSDVFQHKPRGVMVITSYCVEKYTCLNGSNEKITVYPVLFGKRYHGSKASMNVKMDTYMEKATDSIIHRLDIYSHMHTFDARQLGIAWITVSSQQPATVEGCV